MADACRPADQGSSNGIHRRHRALCGEILGAGFRAQKRRRIHSGVRLLQRYCRAAINQLLARLINSPSFDLPRRGPPMNSFVRVALAAATALSLAGCYTPQDRALGGAAIGGLGGAGIGALASGGRAGGTLAGAAIGAASGAAVGALTAPSPPACAQWGYDYYGNSICVAYY